jgi:hypothetical protein
MQKRKMNIMIGLFGPWITNEKTPAEVSCLLISRGLKPGGSAGNRMGILGRIVKGVVLS